MMRNNIGLELCNLRIVQFDGILFNLMNLYFHEQQFVRKAKRYLSNELKMRYVHRR